LRPFLVSDLTRAFAGVGFRPMPDREKHVESTLIKYRHGSEPWEEFTPWVERLEDHLKRELICISGNA